MEFLLVPLAVLAWLAGLAVALVALSRVGELRQQIERLERRLHRWEHDAATRTSAEASEEPAVPPFPTPPAVTPPPVPGTEPEEREPVASAEEPSDVPAAALMPPARSPLRRHRDTGEVPAPPPPRRVDWERWVGVQGAAVIGGLLLALAGVLLYRHAIEQGWITPVRRVLGGLLGGATCLVGGELLRRRGFSNTPQALEGAGTVALYAALWAADVLYDLVALPLSWLGMAIVTLVAGGMAHRSRSPLLACLGLVGGFATPLLLEGGFDEPLVLFGYAFLLDVGLLFLARRHGWHALTALGLAGTLLLEAIWIVRGLEVGDRLLALSVLTGFTLLFAAALTRREGGASPLVLGVRATAILTSFLFAFALSADPVVGGRMHALSLFVAAPALLGQWFAQRDGPRLLGLATGAGVAAFVLIWSVAHLEALEVGWEITANVAGLGLLFLAYQEWQPSRRASEGSLTVGWGLLGVVTMLGVLTAPGSPWPFVVALLVPAAIVLRQGLRRPTEAPLVGGGLALALGLAALSIRHGVLGNAAAPPVATWIALALAPAVVAATLTMRFARALEWAHAGGLVALTSAVVGMAAIVANEQVLVAVGPAHVALVVAAALALAGSRLARRPQAYPWLAFVTFGALALACRPGWGEFLVGTGPVNDPWEAAAFAAWPLPWIASLVACALVTLWPSGLRRRLAPGPASDADNSEAAAAAPDTWAWLVAAAAPLAWWTILDEVHHPSPASAVPEWMRSVAMLALAACAGGLLRDACVAPTERRPARRPARTRWFGLAAFAVTVCLLAGQTTADLARAWTGASASGARFAFPVVAVLAVFLWRRIDATLLSWLASTSAVAGLLRLLWQGFDQGWWLRGWHPFTEMFAAHLGVAVACFVVAAVIARVGPARASEGDEPLVVDLRRATPATLALAGHLAIFAWLNLLVRDLWVPTSEVSGVASRFVQLRLIEEPAWALATSGVWIGYALFLLVLGIRRSSGALRWTSLLALLASLCKVVLDDLGELEGLYRVGSLAGLGLSLLVVPLVYQRFVFGRETDDSSG